MDTPDKARLARDLWQAATTSQANPANPEPSSFRTLCTVDGDVHPLQSPTRPPEHPDRIFITHTGTSIRR